MKKIIFGFYLLSPCAIYYHLSSAEQGTIHGAQSWNGQESLVTSNHYVIQNQLVKENQDLKGCNFLLNQKNHLLWKENEFLKKKNQSLQKKNDDLAQTLVVFLQDIQSKDDLIKQQFSLINQEKEENNKLNAVSKDITSAIWHEKVKLEKDLKYQVRISVALTELVESMQNKINDQQRCIKAYKNQIEKHKDQNE